MRLLLLVAAADVTMAALAGTLSLFVCLRPTFVFETTLILCISPGWANSALRSCLFREGSWLCPCQATCDRL